MVGFIGHTKSFALSANTPVRVAPYSLFRKGVMISNPDSTPVYIALGTNPADTDFFQLGVNGRLLLDQLIPVGPIWAKGVGRLVVLDNEVGLEPYNIQDAFAGTEGVWFDFSDMSTMWQDVNGLIPVTASGQPVGFISGKERALGNSTIGPGAITASGAGVTVTGTTINIDDPASAAGRTFAIVVGAVNPVPGKAVLDITYFGTSGSYRLEAAGMRSIPLLSGRNRYVMDVPAGSTGNFAVAGTSGAGAYKASININNIRRMNSKFAIAKDATKRPTFIKDKQLGYLQFNGTEELYIPNSQALFNWLTVRGSTPFASAAYRSEFRAGEVRLGPLFGNQGLLTANVGTSLSIDRRTSPVKIHNISMATTSVNPTQNQYTNTGVNLATDRNYLTSVQMADTGQISRSTRVSLGETSISITYGYPRPGNSTYDMHIGSAGPLTGHTNTFLGTFLGRLYSLVIVKDAGLETIRLIQRSQAGDAEIPL